MNKLKSKTTNNKLKKNYLLSKFSILSLVSFVILGYIIIAAIPSTLEDLAIKEKESETVVFVNIYANKMISEKDLSSPLTSEKESNIKNFIDHLVIAGVVRLFLIDSEGTVVYSQPEEYIGLNFLDNADIQYVIQQRRSLAIFRDIDEKEQKILGIKEALIQAVPITFGESDKVAGVIYTISRVGLFKKQIQETQEVIAVRIVGGLSFLYMILFVIVFGASRTIANQRSELRSYATTLEKKVYKRTRELEESTKKQLNQAKELARLKDEFVFIAAHELKAPATNLTWSVDTFLSKTKLNKKDNPELFNTLKIVKSSSQALTSLVKDLLNVARLESGTIKISIHPTSLVSVVQDVVSRFGAEAEKKGIHLSFKQVTSNQLPFVSGDSERFKEVFSNLISNAIKFNQKGGKIDVEVKKIGNFLEASVSDTGIGMTKKEIEKLFQKFSRIHPEIEGTGLGLWLSRQLVERMGGSIRVLSKKGQGSIFTVRMPIAKKDGMSESSKTS